MELVYLWIAGYKNIKKQGFNFLPKFECRYDEKSKKLTIDKNEDYLKNLFGENINVTAIVGENGSGKSNSLKAIEQIILDEEHQLFDYVLVYREHNDLNYISNVEIESIIPKKTITENLNTLVYRYKITQEEQHQAHYDSFSYLNYILLDKRGIANLLAYEHNQSLNFNIVTFMYIPNQIEITLKDDNELIQEHIDLISYDKREAVKKLFLSFSQDKYHQFLIICYIRKLGRKLDVDVIKDIHQLKELLEELDTSKFVEYFIKLSSSNIFEIDILSEEQKDIYIKEESYFHFFHVDFIDKKDRRYNDLSHGEQTIFGQLLNIYFYALNNQNILFLFDEPEISLHPSWQRKYFNEVIVLLEALKKKYHFIFTTHSPFLLSDIPKDNIVFLQQDKETGLSLNVTKKVDINPFGANIHTLLSHGFFMSDGLMGEFAKSKITEIKKFYELIKKLEVKIINNKHTKELAKNSFGRREKRFKDIQSIIGEPFLKTIMGNYLDELHLLFSDDDTLIDKELLELEKRKKYLERIKNA